MPQPLPKAISASTENAFGTSGRRLAFNAEDKFCRHINQLADMASLVRWQSHMAGNDTENEPMSSMNAFMQAVGADSLLLDGAEDKAASLCRAWIIQNCCGHPDRDAARLVTANAGDSKVLGYLNRSTLHLRIPTFERNDLWRCFCPSASAASSAPEEMFSEIRRRRALAEIDPSPHPSPIRRLNFCSRPMR